MRKALAKLLRMVKQVMPANLQRFNYDAIYLAEEALAKKPRSRTKRAK